MPRISVPVTDRTLTVIQSLTKTYGVTQQEVIDTLFGTNFAGVTPSQEKKLKELGAERLKSTPAIKKAVRALDGLSDDEINAILAARKGKANEGSGQG